MAQRAASSSGILPILHLYGNTKPIVAPPFSVYFPERVLARWRMRPFPIGNHSDQCFPARDTYAQASFPSLFEAVGFGAENRQKSEQQQHGAAPPK